MGILRTIQNSPSHRYVEVLQCHCSRAERDDLNSLSVLDLCSTRAKRYSGLFKSRSHLQALKTGVMLIVSSCSVATIFRGTASLSVRF
jgi:hypothetical protein